MNYCTAQRGPQTLPEDLEVQPPLEAPSQLYEDPVLPLGRFGWSGADMGLKQLVLQPAWNRTWRGAHPKVRHSKKMRNDFQEQSNTTGDRY